MWFVIMPGSIIGRRFSLGISGDFKDQRQQAQAGYAEQKTFHYQAREFAIMSPGPERPLKSTAC